MSEAELIETFTNFHSLAMGAMVFYLSIVTAYLVVARFVGAELERSQVVIITGLFLVFAAFAVWGSVWYFGMGGIFLGETETYARLEVQQLVQPDLVIGIAEVLGIVAGLKFMLDVRRNRSDP